MSPVGTESKSGGGVGATTDGEMIGCKITPKIAGRMEARFREGVTDFFSSARIRKRVLSKWMYFSEQ